MINETLIEDFNTLFGTDLGIESENPNSGECVEPSLPYEVKYARIIINDGKYKPE